MKIVLNGKETVTAEKISLLALLESRQVSLDTVVVELNREIVPPDSFASTRLNDGDHLEILRFVGGG